jgi:hypothetical protein
MCITTHSCCYKLNPTSYLVVINLLYSCVLFTNSFILFFFTSFFLVKNNPSSNVLDFYSRVHLNEDYVSLFYFFWTSFWYLPLGYLTLVTLVYYLPGVKFLNKLTIVWVLFFTTLGCLDLFEYLFFNLSSTYLVMSSDLVNNLLTNSINKYHPLIFYASTIHLFRSFSVASRSESSPKWEILAIAFTLALGSWWASQEGSWGGWWNWDPSEVFGLLIMLNILVLGHRSLRGSRMSTAAFSKISSSLLIFLVYLFIQLNFDIVSHNFGNKVNTYISSFNLLLLLSVLALLLNISVYLAASDGFRKNLTLFPRLFSLGARGGGPRIQSSANLLPRVYITLLTLVLVTSSFSLLVNDFLWKFMTINVVNYFVDYSVLVNLLALVVIFMVWDLWPATLLMAAACYPHQISLPLLLPFIRSKFGPATSLHTVVLLSFLVNIAFASKALTCWAVLWDSFTSYVSDIPSHQNVVLSANQFNVGITFKGLSLGCYAEYPYGFVSSGSSNEIHTFTHILTSNKLTQELFVGHVLARCSVQVLNFDLNSVSTLVITGLVYLYLTLHSKKVIVF